MLTSEVAVVKSHHGISVKCSRHRDTGPTDPSLLYVQFLTRLLHIVSQAKQSKQLLTEEICLLSEETKYIFLQRKEKKCNLFIYLMNPDNSKIKK